MLSQSFQREYFECVQVDRRLPNNCSRGKILLFTLLDLLTTNVLRSFVSKNNSRVVIINAASKATKWLIVVVQPIQTPEAEPKMTTRTIA
jgi:hypothetical protein